MSAPVAGRVRRGIRMLGRQVMSAFAAIAAVVVAVGYLYGIPEPLVAPVLRRAGPSRYALQADRMRLRGTGARLYGLRLYRKGVPGLPGVEARVADISFSLLWWLAGYDGVSRVRMQDAVCRPEQLVADLEPDPARVGRPSRFAFEVVDSVIARVPIAQCTGTVHAVADEILISPFHARYAPSPDPGFAAGTLRYDRASRRIGGDLVLQHEPRYLMPVIEDYELAALGRLIGMFAFTDATPRLDAVFDYDPRRHDLRVDGEFRLRSFSFRDVHVSRGEGAVSLRHTATNTRVSIDRLFLQRPEGQATGRLAADRERDQVVFDIRSTLHPYAVAGMTGVGGAFLRRRFTFEGPVSAWFVGHADYATLADTAFRARVEAESGSAFSVPFARLVFDADMTGRTLRLPVLVADALDGELGGSVEIEAPLPGEPEEPIPFSLDIALRDLDFRRCLDILTDGGEGDTHGKLGGALTLSGWVDDDIVWERLNGHGNLGVQRGRVFMLPVFGGLSRVMTAIIPGLDFVLRQSDARTVFAIADGELRIERMTIEGDVLSLSARGSMTLPETLNLDVQVRLLKEHSLVARLLRVITYPISKLFEFRVAGTVSDPVWYPVNFSTDLLDRLGGGRGEYRGE